MRQNKVSSKFDSENEFYIKGEELKELLENDLTETVSFCYSFFNKSISSKEILNRRNLGRFFMETQKSEELLDSYGAKGNKYWYSFRKLIAVNKQFARICHNLLNIKYTIGYDVCRDELEADFPFATDNAIDYFADIILYTGSLLIEEAHNIGIHETKDESGTRYKCYRLKEREPSFKVVRDTPLVLDRAVSHNLIYLATNILHTSQNSEILSSYKKILREDYQSYIDSNLTEESINDLANKYHAHITYLDTFIATNYIFIKDKRLLLIRDNLNLIHELLDTLSVLLRYRERHSSFFDKSKYSKPIIEDEINNNIIEYFMFFTDHFLVSIRNTSQNIVKRYSTKKTITVPIPIYRGFHVRPSTLIAKIILHYGSDVYMYLNNKRYNAAIPLELFRANEQINAFKRREIGKILLKDPIYMALEKSIVDAKKISRNMLSGFFIKILSNMQNENKILMYGSMIKPSEDLEGPKTNEKLLDYCKRSTAYLMATGRIDILSNLEVIFEGDSSVLEDIALFAANGYGEDSSGNNILLPSELSYLR